MAINGYHDGLGSVEFSLIPDETEIVPNGQPETFSFEDKWGLPVTVVYRLGLAFHKGTKYSLRDYYGDIQYC